MVVFAIFEPQFGCPMLTPTTAFRRWSHIFSVSIFLLFSFQSQQKTCHQNRPTYLQKKRESVGNLCLTKGNNENGKVAQSIFDATYVDGND